MHPTTTIHEWNWQAARATCLREARRLLGDPEAAEDATQEALVRAWRARATCRGATSQSAWLRTITANEVRRLAARNRRPTERLDGYEPSDPRSELGDPQLGAIALGQVLAVLSPRDRQVVHLRYVAGLTQAQVAEHLGLPEGTVKVRLHRSRARLRTLLSNEALGGYN
jgi:RNA polymerase sigma-70 factor (ECF subfamily)